MTKKVALVSIVVMRDSKPISIQPGQTFDFNKSELEDFAQMEADHNKAHEHLPAKPPFRAIVRDPVNESSTVVDTDGNTDAVNARSARTRAAAPAPAAGGSADGNDQAL